jgi:hypothetical protein
MKRHIIVKVLGEEIVNIFIEEEDAEECVDEADETLPSLSSPIVEQGPRTVGFSTPWTDVWFDDED